MHGAVKWYINNEWLMLNTVSAYTKPLFDVHFNNDLISFLSLAMAAHLLVE